MCRSRGILGLCWRTGSWRLRLDQSAVTATISSFGHADTGMGNPLANAFGPDLMAKLAAEPKFAEYLKDPSFVVKLQAMQRNPNNMQANLSDPRIMEVGFCSRSPVLGTLFTLLTC